MLFRSKSYGGPGYYESKIGSWTNIFAVLQHVSEDWKDCSNQLKQWAALVLIYDAMHFIQQELKRLEARMSCQLWLHCRNKMMDEMTKAQKALLGNCFNLDPFVEIMSFLIRHISPKMTFLKDSSTDYQIFTRPRTDNEILINNELRRNESRLPLRGENQEQVVNSTRK